MDLPVRWLILPTQRGLALVMVSPDFHYVTVFFGSLDSNKTDRQCFSLMTYFSAHLGLQSSLRCNLVSKSLGISVRSFYIRSIEVRRLVLTLGSTVPQARVPTRLNEKEKAG